MRLLFGISLFSIVLITACAQDSDIKTLTTTEFIAQMESDSSLVILDVRTESELYGPLGKIDEAINIPIQELASRVNELEKYKENNIAVICRSGNRSQTGTKILTENGFDAFNVKGGMRQFRSEMEAKK